MCDQGVNVKSHCKSICFPKQKAIFCSMCFCRAAGSSASSFVQRYRIPSVKAVPLFTFTRNKSRRGPLVETAGGGSLTASIRKLDCLLQQGEKQPQCGGPGQATNRPLRNTCATGKLTSDEQKSLIARLLPLFFHLFEVPTLQKGMVAPSLEYFHSSTVFGVFRGATSPPVETRRKTRAERRHPWEPGVFFEHFFPHIMAPAIDFCFELEGKSLNRKC